MYIGYSGVNEATANYISKYILKSDFNHKEFKGKILCSRGIGGNYKNRLDSNRNLYKKNETKEYYVDKEGIKNSLPKYYRNQLYSEEERELLWLEKKIQSKCKTLANHRARTRGYRKHPFTRDYMDKRIIRYRKNLELWICV